MARTSSLFPPLFLFAINSSFILHSFALQFVVGGRDGWVFNPRESYDHWAQRLRFQVNDTLIFRYSNATDSVLAVSKNDYDNCNVDNPVIKLDDGESYFKFGHSGPFYFITANKTNCEKGQKLLIVVLAVRSPPAIPTPPQVPPPSSPPAAAPSPSAPASSPVTQPPAPQTPAGSSPAPSVNPTSPPPVSSSPSPSIAPEASVPSAPGAGSPAAGSIPAAGSTPADVTAPSASPNGSSAMPPFTPLAVSTLAVSFVFIMTFAGLVIS